MTENSSLIGITERADPTVNLEWMRWVDSGHPAILITKNPVKLTPMINPKWNIIIHCTITGLGGTACEPNIPLAEDSLKAYHAFCRLIGDERVVLRIDPIVDDIKLSLLANLVKESEGRVRISFLDLYPHVRQRFKNNGLCFSRTAFHAPLDTRLSIWEFMGKPEVCGEPGMVITPCVSALDCRVLGVEPKSQLKGQRTTCACLQNKYELCRSSIRCSYGCLYCYWR